MTQVTLRPVQPADIETFYEQQLDPIASDMAAFPSREREAFFGHWTNTIMTNRRGVARSILADGVVCGHIVSWVDDEHQQRMLGYWLGREFWGRGIASEALKQYLPEIPDRPIYADFAWHNVGSRRVLEKNGFVPAWPAPKVEHDGVEVMLFVLH
jgi:RimJ/RimL family protein N-acetyltransferase